MCLFSVEHELSFMDAQLQKRLVAIFGKKIDSLSRITFAFLSKIIMLFCKSIALKTYTNETTSF